ISIVYIFIPVTALHNVLFFGGNRFRGFMNDPNYFAVTQSSALMYFLSHRTIKKINQAIISVLIFSILASGSKTGIILLIILLIYQGVHSICSKHIDLKRSIQLTIILLIFTIIIPIIIW